MSDAFQNVLAIDTATRRLNLAVMYLGDRSVKSSAVVPKTHGQILLKQVDDLLLSAGLSVGDLQAIVISLGPGSFTGLRIGLAAAKGMAVARGIPIVGVTLFEVAAMRLKASQRRLHVAIPSRKGEYYLGTLDDSSVGESQVRVIGESEFAACVGHDQVYTIGYDPQLLNDVAPGLVAEEFDYDAGDVLQMGLEKLRASGGCDLASLEPVYLQKAIAEVRFDLRNRGK
jgi:tRNA threonylcarbamoyladenosine biosynthesis protein TsaB